MAKTNYFVQHMGVGRFAQGDVVDLDLLGLTDTKQVDRLLASGALAETDRDVFVVADNPAAPENTRGYPGGNRQATEEEIAQAKTLDPATGMPSDVPVEQARKQTRAEERKA